MAAEMIRMSFRAFAYRARTTMLPDRGTAMNPKIAGIGENPVPTPWIAHPDVCLGEPLPEFGNAPRAPPLDALVLLGLLHDPRGFPQGIRDPTGFHRPGLLEVRPENETGGHDRG